MISLLRSPRRLVPVALAVSLFLTAFGALAIPQGAVAAERQQVRVAMSLTPLSAPVIIAENKRFFGRHGLDVAITDVIGGLRAFKAVSQGKADIATASEAVVMFNSFRRADFAIICTFVTSDNDVKIITRKDTGIRTVGDLAGRRVGTVTGASAQFFLDETLFLAGVNSDRVEVVHVNPEQAPLSLAERKVDAVVIWEPLAYRTRVRLGANAVLVPHDKIYTETFNAVVPRAFAASHPQALEKFIRALVDAVRFIHDNPKQARQIVAARIKGDPRQIDAVWGDFNFDISLHQWLLTTLEKEARWAIRRKLVTARRIPNYLEFMDLRFLQRVRPTAVTVIR